MGQKNFSSTLPDSDYTPTTNAIRYGIFANTKDSFKSVINQIYTQDLWGTFTIGDVTAAILSINIYPFNMHSDTSIEVEEKAIKVLGKTLTNKVKYLEGANSYNVLYFGQVKPVRKYNDFRDLSPYTKIKLILPFYGEVILDNTLVYDKTLDIFLFNDFSTNLSTYFIDSEEDERTIWSGSCQISISVSTTNVNKSINNENFISGLTSIAFGIAGAAAGTMIAPGIGTAIGASAGLSIGSAAASTAMSTNSNSLSYGGPQRMYYPSNNFAEKWSFLGIDQQTSGNLGYGGWSFPQIGTGGMIPYTNDVIGNGASSGYSSQSNPQIVEGQIVASQANTYGVMGTGSKLILLGAFNKMAQGIQHIYQASRPAMSQGTPAQGNSGWFDNKVAYLLYERMEAINFEDIVSQFGRPLAQYKSLSELSGFTIVSNIRFYDMSNNITPNELEVIGTELSNGVIL